MKKGSPHNDFWGGDKPHFSTETDSLFFRCVWNTHFVRFMFRLSTINIHALGSLWKQGYLLKDIKLLNIKYRCYCHQWNHTVQSTDPQTHFCHATLVFLCVGRELSGWYSGIFFGMVWISKNGLLDPKSRPVVLDIDSSNDRAFWRITVCSQPDFGI